ncbi:MAG: RecQ family ATP-dependent DNA helicase, partial [Gemmatimonadales bacterium]
LVVSPLISLMQDQVGAARARGLPAAALNSALSNAEQRRVLSALAAGGIRILYVSPERLRRLAEGLAERALAPALFVVDEAHCISEWGHDFRPAYRLLRRTRQRLGRPAALALTGSATPAVRRDIVESLGLGRGRRLSTVVGSFDRPNLWLGVVRVASEGDRFGALLGLLRREAGLAIVYAPTRGLTEELARILGEAGHRARPYHAGLDAATRRETLRLFLADEIGVVVATCAFGMGIDKPNVRLVVHWSLPATPEAYYQEAGRAGRDGGHARCVLLYRRGDIAVPLRQLEVTFPDQGLTEAVWRGERDFSCVPRNLHASIQRLRVELHPERGPVDWTAVRRRRRDARERLLILERYAEGHGCRRRALLGYFGERLLRCAGCEVCGRAPPARLPSPGADARLRRLRLALAPARALWGGSLLDPRTLRRLAAHPPETERELAVVPGVGPVVAAAFSATILRALRDPGVLA